MADDTGKKLIDTIEVWFNTYFKTHTNDTHVKELLEMYDSTFKDSESTVVLIDEIQESSEVYNKIRSFTRDLRAKFIVTGSYLGKLIDREFFLPAGDLQPLTIYPLSFPEFLGIFGKRDKQKECYDNLTTDKEIEELFNIYQHIGGYPAVVQKYLDTKDLIECYDALEYVIRLFISETQRYFTDIEDLTIFSNLMKAVAVSTMREKRGRYLIEGLFKLLEGVENRPSKKVIARAISWLKECGVIGYSSKLINADLKEEISHARFYFNDIGMANYFADLTGFDLGAVSGFLTENYVYIVLRNKFYKYGMNSRIIYGFEPMFTVYSKNGGELDFILCGKHGGRKIGIEAKAGKNSANTGKRMLEDGLIDQLYLLKGNTKEGVADNTVTLPLYLADAIEFDFGEAKDILNFSELMNIF